MFKCIVVAIDGSPPSERALDTACTLAKAFDSEVHLVHALENKTVEVPLQTSTLHADPSSGAKVMETAGAAAEAMGITPASTTIGEGDAYDEIMTIAQLYGADLIVTGRRGLGNISGLLAGSTSQQIAKHATCAFLSVK